MKKFVDFERSGSLSKAIDQVIGIESADTAEKADLIITESENKVLKYLQTTEKKVVQLYYQDSNHPMTHLIEDYPQRLRVVDVRSQRGAMLIPLLTAISEITK